MGSAHSRDASDRHAGKVGDKEGSPAVFVDLLSLLQLERPAIPKVFLHIYCWLAARMTEA